MPGGTQAHLDFDLVSEKLNGSWVNVTSAAVATDSTIHGALKTGLRGPRYLGQGMHVIGPFRARLALVFVLAVVVVAAAGVVLSQAGRGATTDPLTPDLARELAIQFDGLDATSAGAVVSDTAAARIAQEYFATDEVPAGVRHGRAPQYLNSPVRSVWVVTFTGVGMPW